MMDDWNEAEQEFGQIITEIIESKYKKYEGKYPIEQLKIELKYFEDYVNIMSHIAILQGYGRQNYEKTTKSMFYIFSNKGEIEHYSKNVYQLTKKGQLYKKLSEDLSNTDKE